MSSTAKCTDMPYYYYSIQRALLSRESLAKGVRYGFALSQFTADASSFGFFVFLQLQSLPLALLFGISSGLISFTLTWGFKGHVIKDCLTQADPKTLPSKPTDRKDSHHKSVADAAIWSLTLLRCIQEFGMNYFFFDSVIGWIKTFYHDTTLKLTRLNQQHLLCVLAYTLIVNIPFLLSNEIYETAEEIHEVTGIENAEPSIICLLKPLALFRSFITVAGPFYKSTEHLINMLMLIPNIWIINMVQCSTLFAGLGLTGLVVSAGLLFSVHLVQSYFFEGRYSNKNLLKASGDNDSPETSYAIQNDKQAGFLTAMHQLLNTQAIFQALEDTRTIVTAASEMGLGRAAYLLGALQCLMVSIGIQCSDIYAAKKETRILLDEYYHSEPTSRPKAEQSVPSLSDIPSYSIT